MTQKTAAHHAPLSITNSRSLLKLMSIELVMSSKHFILCRSLLLQPSIFPRIRVFSNEFVLHIRWPEYWSFSLSISPFSEYAGPISFRIDWFDLLAVQGTPKSLLQHHNSKASIEHSVLFIAQLSHPYISSVTQLCLTLCEPMDCSRPGFPVHLQYPVSTQTHVHRVSDAIQSSHPLSSPSPPAFNLLQNQSLFQ